MCCSPMKLVSLGGDERNEGHEAANREVQNGLRRSRVRVALRHGDVDLRLTGLVRRHVGNDVRRHRRHNRSTEDIDGRRRGGADIGAVHPASRRGVVVDQGRRQVVTKGRGLARHGAGHVNPKHCLAAGERLTHQRLRDAEVRDLVDRRGAETAHPLFNLGGGAAAGYVAAGQGIAHGVRVSAADGTEVDGVNPDARGRELNRGQQAGVGRQVLVGDSRCQRCRG